MFFRSSSLGIRILNLTVFLWLLWHVSILNFFSKGVEQVQLNFIRTFWSSFPVPEPVIYLVSTNLSLSIKLRNMHRNTDMTWHQLTHVAKFFFIELCVFPLLASRNFFSDFNVNRTKSVFFPLSLNLKSVKLSQNNLLVNTTCFDYLDDCLFTLIS